MAAAPGGSWGFLAITIVAFIILGTVLEGLPAIVLFGPLLFPVAKAVGVNEVHYAMVVILAMRIGLFAPPFGIGFFSACAIGRTNPATPCGGSASGRIPSRPVPRPATAVRTAEVAGTDRSQLHQFASAHTWRIVRLGVREGRPPAVRCRQLAFRASGRRPAAERIEAAGVDQLAGKLVADDLLGHAPDLDQRIEIHAGIDAHLLAEQHQLLGTDVAGGLGLTGKRAAAEPADRRVELPHAHLQPGMSIGNREAARVVQ